MNLKYLGTLLLFGLISLGVFSQAREDNSRPSAAKTSPKNKGFQLDKVVVGGNLGAQFGDLTLIEVSPTVGYKLTEKWLAGVGARYIYVKPRLFPSTNIIGGAIFQQYAILEQVVLHAEFEYLSFENIYNPGERFDFYSPLVGAGYRSSIGGNAFASFLVLFNLNDDINSPYTNPILRFNFGFGL
ncbi:MAG: hypothetical protein ACJAV5_000624 [Vicingaceae bacterium]|jgi:hypothetical protein